MIELDENWVLTKSDDYDIWHKPCYNPNGKFQDSGSAGILFIKIPDGMFFCITCGARPPEEVIKKAQFIADTPPL